MNPLLLATIVVLAWIAVTAALLKLDRAEETLLQHLEGPSAPAGPEGG